MRGFDYRDGGTGGFQERLQQVRALAGGSALLLALCDASGGRLTMPQAAFFMLAAAWDSLGQPATRAQLLKEEGGRLNRSVKNTYRHLLAASRRHPEALGWLQAVPNEADLREHHLILTDRGSDVIDAALAAVQSV